MVGVIAEQLAKAQHGRPRVLVMAQGKMARRSLAAIRETGVWTVVPQAGDWRLDINPKLADEAVRLGQKPLRQLFYNAYAVLQAAQEAQVCAIFLDGPCAFLASDNPFPCTGGRSGHRGVRCL